MYVSFGSTPVIRLNYSGIPMGRSGNGPQLVIPRIPANFLDAAKVAIPGYKNGDPKAVTCPEKGVYPSYTPSS